MQARIVYWKDGRLSLYVHNDYDNVTLIANFPAEKLFHTHQLWPGGSWKAAEDPVDWRKHPSEDPVELVDYVRHENVPPRVPDWVRAASPINPTHTIPVAMAKAKPETAMPPPKKPTRETVVIEDKRTFKQLLRDFIGRY